MPAVKEMSKNNASSVFRNCTDETLSKMSGMSPKRILCVWKRKILPSGAIPHLNHCKYIKLENEFALQNSGDLCGGIYWVVKYDQRRCNLLEAPRHVTAHYGETFPFSIWSGDLVRQRQETHKIAEDPPFDHPDPQAAQDFNLAS